MFGRIMNSVYLRFLTFSKEPSVISEQDAGHVFSNFPPLSSAVWKTSAF